MFRFRNIPYFLDLSAITFNEKGSAIDPLENFQFTPNDYAVILTKGSDACKAHRKFNTYNRVTFCKLCSKLILIPRYCK